MSEFHNKKLINLHPKHDSFKKPKEPYFSKSNVRKLVKYGLIILVFFAVLNVAFNAPLYYNRIRFWTKKSSKIAEVKTPSPSPSPIEEVFVQETAPTAESRLLVSKIGIDVPIIFVDSIKDEDIKEGLRKGVVHYDKTALPGEEGNIFITGHSSNYWWEKGDYNYVFSLLDKLATSDEAVIYYKSKVFRYKVFDIKIVEPTDLSVLEQTQESVLSLMTCYPPGTDWQRIVVRFKQTYPVVEKPAPKVNVIPKVTPTQLPKTDQKSFFTKIGNFFGDIFNGLVRIFGFLFVR